MLAPVTLPVATRAKSAASTPVTARVKTTVQLTLAALVFAAVTRATVLAIVAPKLMLANPEEPGPSPIALVAWILQVVWLTPVGAKNVNGDVDEAGESNPEAQRMRCDRIGDPPVFAGAVKFTVVWPVAPLVEKPVRAGAAGNPAFTV